MQYAGPLTNGVMPSPADVDAAKGDVRQLDDAQGGDGPEIVHQAQEPAVPNDKNFGVDWDKIEPHRVTLNGRSISCDRAIERIAAQVPDDKHKLRLVVIGTKEEREPVRKAWDSAPQEVRDRVSPWFCPADHWSLRDTVSGEPRFKLDGHPTIYLLGPDGESIGRMDGFTGAPDVEAIRKAAKKYDASKDADLRRPDPPKKDDKPKSPDNVQGTDSRPLAFALGVGVALVIFMRRKATT